MATGILCLYQEILYPRISADKESPKVCFTNRGGRGGQGVTVSCFCQQLTGLTNNGVPVLVRNSCWPKEVKSLVSTYPGTLFHLGVPSAFSWFQIVSSVWFVRESSLPGPFPDLTSWFMGLATFLHQNKSNNGECYYWPLGIIKEAKSPGAAATALNRRQEGCTTGESRQDWHGSHSSTGPHCPWASGTEGRPARGSGQIHVSFSLPSPVMPQYDPLKGVQSRLLWRLRCVCATPGYQVTG